MMREGPSLAKDKMEVYGFWNRASCGEELYLDDRGYEGQAEQRYSLEPYILEFADFPSAAGKDVLEVGVGLGADHEQFARAGAVLSGIDLTPRAIHHTRQRLQALGFSSNLQVGDAENLPFPDDSFDLVYSWGVIHHSPDTEKAAKEILRVLRPGGRFAVMIYHRYSLVGLMLWLRYALLSGKPFTSLTKIYANHLESPGTKAYSVSEAKALFSGARAVSARTVLTHGDLLESAAGQRHEGLAISLARRIWPRKLLQWAFPKLGLFLLIEGRG